MVVFRGLYVFPGYAPPQIAALEAAKASQASQSAELTGIITGLQQQLEDLQREKSRLEEQTTLDHASIVRLRAQVDDYNHQLQSQPQPQPQPQLLPQPQPQPSQPPQALPQQLSPTPAAAMAVEDARRIKDLSEVRCWSIDCERDLPLTHSINIASVTHPINTLITHSIATSCQLTLSTHHINTMYEHILSTQYINTSYITHPE